MHGAKVALDLVDAARPAWDLCAGRARDGAAADVRETRLHQARRPDRLAPSGDV